MAAAAYSAAFAMANDSREQLQITSRTKVEDIRRGAGFTDVGWRKFLVRRSVCRR